jgi:small subunit ribosomal protein S19
MVKQYSFKGKTLEELQALKVDDFIKLLPARKRRTYKRGMTEEEQKFLKSFRADANDPKKVVRTHCRDMIILPEMAGHKVAVYNGHEFTYVDVAPDMIGHCLGEFALTRKAIKHSAAGIGATRSTKFISVK